MTKPLRVSKESKDTYIIKLYDDTTKKYDSNELTSQLKSDLNDNELSQVLNLSDHQEATINLNKNVPKKVLISDYLDKYYGIPDEYSRKFIKSADKKVLTVVTPDGIYSKKFDTKENCNEELKRLYNLDDAEFLNSLEGFHQSLNSIKNESLETDAKQLAKELTKNKIIDKSQQADYLKGILDSNYDYYPKPLQVNELQKGDVFCFVSGQGYEKNDLLKVIDIYNSSDGKIKSKEFYDIAVVSYPHYQYRILQYIPSDYAVLLMDSSLATVDSNELDDEIYSSNPGVLSIGDTYSTKNFPNQVKKVLLIDSKQDVSGDNPYDSGKYYFINYKIVDSDIKDEVGEEGTDVLTSNETVHYFTEDYNDVYVMSGTEAEARGNLSRKDRLDVMNRHKYSDYNKKEREAYGKKFPDKSAYNMNVFSDEYKNNDDTNDPNNNNGLHVNLNSKNKKESEDNHYVHTQISAKKPSYKISIPLNNSFGVTVNNNTKVLRDKYRLG